VLNNFPRIDILVNNAGLFFPGALATEPDDQLENLMQTNVYSAYHLTRAFLPTMKQQKSGHIFNMCSVASLRAYPNGGAYSITKYALLGFSENLRYELMGDGIKVTAISPGAVWTNSWSGSGVAPERIMKAADVAEILWTTYNLSAQATVEHIVLRPQLGDL
jgi:short-subunit dehydrogenase